MTTFSRGLAGAALGLAFIASFAACRGDAPSSAAAPAHAPTAAAPEASRPPGRVGEVTFENVLSREEQVRSGERTSPYVNLAEPEHAIAMLIDPDRIVVERASVVVHVDYPLKRPVKETLVAPSSRGFTRADLAKAIARLYARIYAEEERTARVKTVPREQRRPILNRNETDGTYGIWGHDLSDLDLHTVTVNQSADGSWFLELEIDS